MRTFLSVLSGAALWLSCHSYVAAQPGPVKVGQCFEQNTGNLDVVEYVHVYPNGASTKFTKIVRPPSWGRAVEVYDAGPDPSGLHLLWVQSGVAGVQFWIARNGAILAIGPQIGVQQTGGCNLNAAYAAQFLVPTPTPIAAFQPIAFNYNPGNPSAATPTGPAFNIPAALFAEGIYVGNPVLLKLEQVEDCVERAQGDEGLLYQCALDHSLGKNEKAALKCAQSANDQQALALCLIKDRLPGPQQRALADLQACQSQHGTNWNAYPACLAGKQMDPQVINVIGCAQQQMRSGHEPNYWTLGYCAFGQQLFDPNPESAIAIQCAMETGGNPKLFAVCTGGRLMVRELDKCFEHGVGGDDGCFGKNNSITLAYDKIENELKKALGENSVAFHAWQAARLGTDPGKMAEAVNNAQRELDRAAKNTEEEVARAAQKATELIGQVVPKATVGSNGVELSIGDTKILDLGF